ncbi:MAG: hypothetical protein HOK72_13200 [Flavobacteriales bacterium]|nr:hypothetical protein [Flavobacteriales bacterium]
MMTLSFLFGDNNVQVRHGDQQVAQGEFIGTYMNHVHILIGEKIIYYACDDIISITSITSTKLIGKVLEYDCSKNTVTADILFPPEFDPMTGEMAQLLPDVFNPDIPRLSVEKATPVVQKPAAKIEAGGVSTAEDFVIIDGVKYARVALEEEKKRKKETTLSTLEIRSLALMNARQTHVRPGWGLLGLAGCGTGLMGGGIGGEMADFPGFLIGGALGLSLPSLIASGSASSISVPYYPAEIKTQNEKQLYKDAYVKETSLLRRGSTVTGTGVGLLGFGAFMLVLIMSF